MKKAEEELKKTMAFLHNIIENSLDGIVVIDSDGKIIKTNNAFLKMIKYDREKVIGETLKAFSPPSEGTYKTTAGDELNIDKDFLSRESRERINILPESGISKNWKTFYIRRDNKLIPVEENVGFVYDAKGEQIGSVAVIRDITERRSAKHKLKDVNRELADINLQLEQSIERANQMAVMAEVANTTKSEFLANMSHDIRTPLNSIIGFTEMLHNTKLDSEQTDFIRTIKENGDLLLTIINSILDFSKIESGKVKLESIEFDPEVLSYNVCEIIRGKIRGKPVELLYSIGENVPPKLKGDPHRFRLVLLNLMFNAEKFTDSGKIELLLDVDEEQDKRIKIRAKVSDTGIGIPMDKPETIFDAFTPADGSSTRLYRGVGLGLSICKKVSNLMGGDVWYARNKEGGSTFHFTAWLKKSGKPELNRALPVSLKNKKVLIVDDNQKNIDLILRFLESAGMRAIVLKSGKEIISTLEDLYKKGKHVDLLALNVQIPDADGYGIPKRIKQLGIPDIPLLSFSSNVDKDAKRCQKAGFDGYLPKSANRKKLLTMIEHLLCKEKDSGQERKPKKIATQHSITEQLKHSVNILLADDSPVNQKMAFKMLTKAGYSVETANNGKEAVGKYTKEPDKFDLIFMDKQMPEINGLEATKQIRDWELRDSEIKIQGAENSAVRKVPIVGMTANIMEGERENCMEAGMNDCVDKPVKREMVFEIIHRYIIDRTEKEL